MAKAEILQLVLDWTYSQKFFCHFRWYRCHLEFCYCSAVLHRLLLNCGSALWLTVCAAGWATPGQGHLSFSEQWMTQQQRCSLDSTLCHLTVGRIGEREDGRRWAELRFRASPSHISSTHTIAHVVKLLENTLHPGNKGTNEGLWYTGNTIAQCSSCISNENKSLNHCIHQLQWVSENLSCQH